MLALAAIGGLEMIDEDFLVTIPQIQTTCCIIHAVQNHAGKSEKDKRVLTLLKIFDRLSEDCREFICACMQQRFSKNEMKRYQIKEVYTASDLRTHAWL